MTSYEIVKGAINRERPERLPVRMESLGVSDTAGVPLRPPEGWKPEQPGMDEWGCVWDHTDIHNMGQVKVKPLDNLSKLDNYPMPDYNDDSRYVSVTAVLDKYFLLKVAPERRFVLV